MWTSDSSSSSTSRGFTTTCGSLPFKNHRRDWDFQGFPFQTRRIKKEYESFQLYLGNTKSMFFINKVFSPVSSRLLITIVLIFTTSVQSSKLDLVNFRKEYNHIEPCVHFICVTYVHVIKRKSFPRKNRKGVKISDSMVLNYLYYYQLKFKYWIKIQNFSILCATVNIIYGFNLTWLITYLSKISFAYYKYYIVFLNIHGPL